MKKFIREHYAPILMIICLAMLCLSLYPTPNELGVEHIFGEYYKQVNSILLAGFFIFMTLTCLQVSSKRKLEKRNRNGN